MTNELTIKLIFTLLLVEIALHALEVAIDLEQSGIIDWGLL